MLLSVRCRTRLAGARDGHRHVVVADRRAASTRHVPSVVDSHWRTNVGGVQHLLAFRNVAEKRRREDVDDIIDLSISQRAARFGIVMCDENVCLDALALLSPLGLGIEKADDAIGIAHGGYFRINNDRGRIGKPHGERCTTLDAGRTVADHPIEPLPHLVDDTGNAAFGQSILASGLRVGSKNRVSRGLSRMSAYESVAAP